MVAKYGDGGDLQIVHNGTDTQINNATGNLQFTQLANDKDISFASDNGSGGDTIYFFLDGSLASGGSVFTVFPDNSSIVLGTGNDLQAKHNGTDTTFDNYTGDLKFQNYADDKDIVFSSDDGSGGLAEYFRVDGGLALSVASKHIRFEDSVEARFGTGGDARIFHDATDTYLDNFTGHLYIRNNSDDKDIIFQSDDQSGGLTTYFHIDGGDGRIKIPDSTTLQLGDGGDLQFQHDATDSLIRNYTGDLDITNFADDKYITFNCDDGSGGVTEYFRVDGALGYMVASKHILLTDTTKLRVGSSADLEIQHDATNSYIANNTGDLYIQNNSDDRDIYFQTDDGSGGTTTYFHCDGSLASSGFTTTKWPDQMQIALGDDRDLRLWHQSSNNYIAAYTGDLYIKNETDDGDVIFQSDNGSGGLSNYIVLDGGDVSTKIETIKVLMPNLPTSDPSVAGQLWNSSGDLKISAG